VRDLVAPAAALAIPEVAQIAKDMAAKPDIPFYETSWIDDEGQPHHIALTPRMLLMAGGGILLVAVAYGIYQILKEANSSFLSGGPGAYAALLSIGGGLAGLPIETVDDLRKGGGGASVIGNLVKYSNPVLLGADLLGVPVDESVEKYAKKIGNKVKGWFS